MAVRGNMQYHQIDFMKENGVIEDRTVDLFFSSVPLDILKNQLEDLFGIIKRIMKPYGWVIIDAPVSLNIFEDLQIAGADAGFPWRRSDKVWDMYPGINQWLHIHGKYEMGSPEYPGHVLGHKALTPVRIRKIGHECEFCPDLIAFFIEQYSRAKDVVLDPFCGTGTVPGEAEVMYRKGIGCDLRPYENILEEYRES